MGAEKLQSIAKPADREKIILDHYKWLLDWASQLTRGSKEEAEDLVQDVYVRFIQSTGELDLSDPDKIKGYLYTTIRNLATSKALRQGRDVLSNLQVIDFDSVEFALTAVDRSKLLLVRSDLASICEYACLRRKTSHAAGVLILRFFCGYYPSEIVKLLLSTPGSVNKLIENARLEAKAYLTRPGSLTFIEQPIRMTTPSRSLPDDPSSLFLEIRRRIFADPEGECFAPDQLRVRYGTKSGRFSKREFAHLVSCRRCLDDANQILGLEPLSMRFPPDGSGSNGGNRPSGPGDEKALGLRRKLQQTYEHRPAKLEVAVNGEVRGAQVITSSHSKFQIKLRPLSQPQFVELLSEQGVRLLYLNLDTQDVSIASPQHAETELSDHRQLSVDVAIRAGARVIEVSYYDPTLDEVSEGYSADIVEPPAIRGEAEIKAVEQAEPRWTRLRAGLSRWFTGYRWPIGLIVASGLVLFFIGFGIQRARKAVTESSLNGPALIARSIEASNAAAPPHGAIRRTFSLDVRSDKGDLLSSAKVETLRSQAPRRSALRLTSPDGKILAGQWIDEAGKVTTYSPERGLKRSAKVPIPETPTFDNAWQHPPDAADFTAVSSGTQNLVAHQSKNVYEVGFDNTHSTSGPQVISADLTIAADSMRPVAETLRVRDHQQVRQYQFKELSYEVLQPNQLRDSDFEPDTQLVSLRTGATDGLDLGIRNAHLALDALQLLNNLGSDVEQLVELDRLPDGTVQINGVLPTSEQRASIEHVFESLSQEGQLKLALHSNDEAPARSAVHRAATVEELAPVAVENERVPLDAEIRASLAAKGVPESEMNGRIDQMASNTLSHAARMHREAWIICQISTKDFSHADLQSMPPPDRILWLTLLDKHIRTLDEELTVVTGDLKPLLQNQNVHSPPTPTSNPNSIPNNLSELGKVAEVLNTDGERLDRLLTAGLTLSPQSLPSNHNVADIAELLTDLRIRESMLHGTVERLQAFGQAELTR